MGATDPCEVAAKLHKRALLHGTAQSLARRVPFRRCPEAHGHSPRVPAPARPRPLTSLALGRAHAGKLQFFHLKGPDLYFSCGKHVTAPSPRALLEAAFTRPLFGRQRSLQRSHPSQAEESCTAPTSPLCNSQASSHGQLRPGLGGDSLLLPTAPRRIGQAGRRGSAPAASLIGTHQRPPAERTQRRWGCNNASRKAELLRKTFRANLNKNHHTLKCISCPHIISKSQRDILQIRVENEHFMNDELYFFIFFLKSI